MTPSSFTRSSWISTAYFLNFYTSSSISSFISSSWFSSISIASLTFVLISLIYAWCSMYFLAFLWSWLITSSKTFFTYFSFSNDPSPWVWSLVSCSWYLSSIFLNFFRYFAATCPVLFVVFTYSSHAIFPDFKHAIIFRLTLKQT